MRNARERPSEENTPPSKVNFKKDSDEAARLRQGGARLGHKGHGRRRVPAEDADERREALRYDDPAAKLAQALDIYASSERKSTVRDFLFPKAGRLDCAQHQAQR